MSLAQPNLLIFVVDQLTGTLWPDGPAPFLRAKNLRALAERSLRFRNAYTPSPLCAPSRASLMTGQLPSKTGVYDNAALFPTDIPTFAHYLRRAGYQTCLAGKMHFVGPDQLHGFEERLTTEIYPADYGWTPDWEHPAERIDWWYHNMDSVRAAGVAEITNQLEFDDEVAYRAGRKLHDLARRRDTRPWCLTVSFTHPHDPFVARPRYFELYESEEGLDPVIAPIPFECQDPHSQRLMVACDQLASPVTPEQVRRARKAYFANISYLDDQIGELLAILERGGFADNTAVLFLSDHGDMLGERGMWYKMSFFEGSARVPLMIAAPNWAPRSVETPVSTLDILPTLCELAGAPLGDGAAWLDGESLVALAEGRGRRAAVAMEYAAEGSVAPMVALRQGKWKAISAPPDPPQLFDLEADPYELANLAGRPDHSDVWAGFSSRFAEHWDLAAFDKAVRASQQRRRLVCEGLRQGAYTPWDFEPHDSAARRYMRNDMDLNVVEATQRYPRAG